MRNHSALQKAARALAQARAASMTPEQRTESARKAAEARWSSREDRTKMVTAVRVRLSTLNEQRQGLGDIRTRRIVYNLARNDVATRLRVAARSCVLGITTDDVIALDADRLRETALVALYGAEKLARHVVDMDPDPVGDKLSAEAIHQQGEILTGQRRPGETISVVRKSFDPAPGRPPFADTIVRYRVPSIDGVKRALLKAAKEGLITPGALAAMNAGRLPEGALLKAMPDARRVDGRDDLLKAARDLDELVAERNSQSDIHRFEQRMLSR